MFTGRCMCCWLSVGLNTVFSLIYYIRVLKTMFLDERPADAPRVRIPGVENLYVGLLATFVLLLGFAPVIAEHVIQVVGNAANSVFLTVTSGGF